MKPIVVPQQTPEWFEQAQMQLAAEIEKRKRWAAYHATRAVTLFVVWLWVPKPWWAGLIAFWATAISGTAALWDLEHWRIAVMQRRIPPY
ncbi:MAG: hypothetical protein ACXVAR_18985 [Vulcanimicrobiaceae bacterium]